MKKVIIIGATSGIGKALAENLAKQGYILGVTGRRGNLLQNLKNTLNTTVYTKEFDISNTKSATQKFTELLEEMQGADIVIINSGTGYKNPDFDLNLDIETINTNVLGFVTIGNLAFQHFKKQKYGQLIGISSITALRGNPYAPVYSASKAFVSNYLEGLRLKAINSKCDIVITDIKPGFVDTNMAQGDKLFWVASTKKAAKQIIKTIRKGRKHAYVTKRWRIIAWIMKLLPARILSKI